MRIRRFKKEDARKVSNIIKKNMLTITYKEDPKKTIEILIKNCSPSNLIKKSKKRKYYVAVEKNEILGVGAYENNEIHTFFVNPKHHGKHIGKTLMERVLKDAKKEGIKTMNCNSSFYAEKFYAKFGFKKIKKMKVPFYDSTINFILMRKKL